MGIGDDVGLFSHDGFRRFLSIVAIVQIPNGSSCFRTNEGTLFYVEPDKESKPYAGKRYNVGNKAFWIE